MTIECGTCFGATVFGATLSDATRMSQKTGAAMSFDAMGRSAPAPNFGVLARNSGAAPPPVRLWGQEPKRSSSSSEPEPPA